MTRYIVFLATCLMSLAATASTAPTPMTFLDGWVRAAPPVAKVMAGYGVVHNTSGQSLRIESLSSPEFERVELHEMSMNDGVMTMRRRDPMVVEPEQTLTLKPGGWHLMLIGPKTPQPAGNRVHVTFHTDQGEFEFIVTVREPKS